MCDKEEYFMKYMETGKCPVCGSEKVEEHSDGSCKCQNCDAEF